METRWVNPRRMAVVISIASIFIVAEAPSQVTTAQKSVEKTGLELQQQGFKTDLTNFNFSTSSELRVREAILQATAPDRRVAPFNDYPNLMEPVGSNKVIVVWQQASLRRQTPSWQDAGYELTWDDFDDAINHSQAQIDAACAAILSGPIQFNLDASA